MQHAHIQPYIQKNWGRIWKSICTPVLLPALFTWEAESRQMSLSQWTDKQTAIYTKYYRDIYIQWSLKKEEILSHGWMDEAWGYSARWNKPVIKRQMLYDSTYMRCKIVKIVLFAFLFGHTACMACSILALWPGTEPRPKLK